MIGRRRLLLALLALVVAAPAAPARGQDTEASADETTRAWRSRARTAPSRHYAVTTDLEPELAERLARHMDLTREEYAKQLGWLRIRRRQQLELLLFRDESDYHAFLRTEFEMSGRGTAGLCATRRSRVALCVWQGARDPREIEKTLQHEGFHQIAHAVFSSLPLWLNEGLAEVFEHGVAVDDGLVLGEVPSSTLSALRRHREAGTLSPFEALFDTEGERWIDAMNRGHGGRNYAQSWAIVHFLLYANGGGHRRSFEALLDRLANGQSWQSAYAQTFGSQDYGEFEARWLAYLDGLRATDLRETAARLEFLAAGMLALRAEQVYPTTREALRTALVERDFQHRCRLAGEHAPRSAKQVEGTLLTVPFIEKGAKDAGFRLVEMPKKKGRSARRSRSRASRSGRGGDGLGADATAPDPPAIVAAGTWPVQLVATWTQDRASGEWSYRIVRAP